MGVSPEPAYPLTPAKPSRASMCSECLPQAWLFRGPAGSSDKHPACPTVPHPHPCQTPRQESRALALRAAIHLNPSGLLWASAALAALAATCGALAGSRHCRKNSTWIISCNPTPAAARGGPTILNPTFQMKKSGGAQACYCLPFPEQGVGEPELSVLPWPGFQSRERCSGPCSACCSLGLPAMVGHKKVCPLPINKPISI